MIRDTEGSLALTIAQIATHQMSQLAQMLTIATTCAASVDEALVIAGCVGDLVRELQQIENLALTQADRLSAK